MILRASAPRAGDTDEFMQQNGLTEFMCQTLRHAGDPEVVAAKKRRERTRLIGHIEWIL